VLGGEGVVQGVHVVVEIVHVVVGGEVEVGVATVLKSGYRRGDVDAAVGCDCGYGYVHAEEEIAAVSVVASARLSAVLMPMQRLLLAS